MYLSDIRLITLLILIYLIFTTTLYGLYQDCPHLTDEETDLPNATEPMMESGFRPRQPLLTTTTLYYKIPSSTYQ